MATEVIYALECAQGKYYVGKTRADRVETRYAEHVSGRGSAWTSKFKPQRIMWYVRCTDPLQEDMEVKKLMRVHRIKNVRGGSYSKVELSPEDINQLTKALVHADDRCFRCGGTGHFSGSCRVKMCDLSGHCGRTGHHLDSNCYARTDVNDRPLYEGSAQTELAHADARCFRCGGTGHFSSSCRVKMCKICGRCGRTGHLDSNCYARTDVNGSPLYEESSEEEESSDEDEDCCMRCGRDGHDESGCYARYGVDGTRL